MADKTIQEQIADKLLEINTAKLDIKDAIESKGRDLTEVAFSGYADEIEAISGAIEQVADMDALEELTPTNGRVVEVLEGCPAVVELTQDEYDALDSYCADTYYIIIEDDE